MGARCLQLLACETGLRGGGPQPSCLLLRSAQECGKHRPR